MNLKIYTIRHIDQSPKNVKNKSNQPKETMKRYSTSRKLTDLKNFEHMILK